MKTVATRPNRGSHTIYAYVLTVEQVRHRNDDVHQTRVVSVHQSLVAAKRAGLKWATSSGLPPERVIPFQQAQRLQGESLVWQAILLFRHREEGDVWVQITRYEVLT